MRVPAALFIPVYIDLKITQAHGELFFNENMCIGQSLYSAAIMCHHHFEQSWINSPFIAVVRTDHLYFINRRITANTGIAVDLYQKRQSKTSQHLHVMNL